MMKRQSITHNLVTNLRYEKYYRIKFSQGFFFWRIHNCNLNKLRYDLILIFQQRKRIIILEFLKYNKCVCFTNKASTAI